MQANSRRTNPASFLIVILLIALSVVITYYVVKSSESNQREEIVADKDQEIQDLTLKMENLSKELDAKIREAKKLGSDYKNLQEYKNQLETDIEVIRKNADVSDRQVRQYLAKIQGYEQVMKAKDEELAMLRAENEELLEARDSLNSEAGRLEGENESLSSTVEEYQEDNKRLNQAAATLKAENLNIIALNKKGKEESRNVFRARRIGQIKVDFFLGANSIASAGNRTINFRLIEPGGTVLFRSGEGGKFTDEKSGKELSYTKRSSVNYTNDRKAMSILYEKQDDYDFKEGTYTVELYEGGKLIGYKSFKVD